MKIAKTYQPCNAPADLTTLTFPKLVSIKKDGVKGRIVNKQVLSRSGKPIKNKFIQKTLAPLAGRGFEGELLVYDDDGKLLPWNDVNSQVMSEDGEPNFKFYLFDLWDNGRSYENRHDDLRRQITYCAPTVPGRLSIAFNVVLRSLSELLDYEKNVLLLGHEGLILREPISWYKNGKATPTSQEFLKLKRAIDDDGNVIDYFVGEAEVVSFEEYMITEESGKYTDETGNSKSSSAAEFKVPGNMLGALYLRTPEGVEFKVGTGLSWELRRQLWDERGTLAGKLVKYKSMPFGALDKPRHPVFLGIRDRMDLDSDPFGLAIV